ncbi:RNA-directed DNA polymerase [candidate division KSB1 bacterium]|nr:RNA-directed DNA polymerase [candidate division KSB1 bacterium]
MKRQGHLIEKIADIENLQLAYYKAQKGKSAKPAVYEYGKRLSENLQQLQQQILTGEVEVGNYHYFTLYDPKKRLICAAPFPQRVFHHALMNICHPFFEKIQIFDSYASRIGKGTYSALERARYFNQHYQWFLKLDFRKYFDSIDHIILKKQLGRIFKDSRLLNILAGIIDSYAINPGKGVPIGNLTSQYFANHYLACLDHFVKEILKIEAYDRYMDDMVLWHQDKNYLLQAGKCLSQYAEQQLALTLKPFCLNHHSRGLPFLGYLVYPDQVRLAHRSRIRFIRKLRLYENKLLTGIWDQKAYQNHIIPLIAFTEKANAREFRKKMIDQTFGV